MARVEIVGEYGNEGRSGCPKIDLDCFCSEYSSDTVVGWSPFEGLIVSILCRYCISKFYSFPSFPTGFEHIFPTLTSNFKSQSLF